MSTTFSILMASALVVASGFFSGSETALFCLGPEQRTRAGVRVQRLLAAPRDLLVSILLGNLVINLLFFSAVPLMVEHEGAQETLAVGLGALLVLLVFGEILPKTLALRSPVLAARLVVLPLSLVVSVLAPLRRVTHVLLDALLRALGETERAEHAIQPDVLAAAMERSAREGHLAHGEADLLSEIVELGVLRVREIMTPRVDMLALDLEADEEERAAVFDLAKRRRITWLPVIRGDADKIAGRIEVRDVLAYPERPLERLVMPVTFVPEVAGVLTMLQTLRQQRVAEAVVVDEWGGTAGVVTLEDLFEEIVGELRVEEELVEKLVVPLGEGRYRISGRLSIHDWNELLGTEVVPSAFETVGGYLTALLGRIPRKGDQVELGGALRCEVHEVRGRRVHTLDLWLRTEPEGADA